MDAGGAGGGNRTRNQALEPFSPSACASPLRGRAASPTPRRARILDGTRRSSAAQPAGTEQSAIGLRSTQRTSPPGSGRRLLRGSFCADFHRGAGALDALGLAVSANDFIVSANSIPVKGFAGTFSGCRGPWRLRRRSGSGTVFSHPQPRVGARPAGRKNLPHARPVVPGVVVPRVEAWRRPSRITRFCQTWPPGH